MAFEAERLKDAFDQSVDAVYCGVLGTTRPWQLAPAKVKSKRRKSPRYVRGGSSGAYYGCDFFDGFLWGTLCSSGDGEGDGALKALILFFIVIFSAAVSAAYGLAKVGKWLLNLVYRRRMLRSLWKLAVTAGVSYGMAQLGLMIVLVNAPGMNILVGIVLGAALGLGIGAFIGKQLARLFSLMVVGNTSGKYLSRAEKRHLQDIQGFDFNDAKVLTNRIDDHIKRGERIAEGIDKKWAHQRKIQCLRASLRSGCRTMPEVKAGDGASTVIQYIQHKMATSPPAYTEAAAHPSLGLGMGGENGNVSTAYYQV